MATQPLPQDEARPDAAANDGDSSGGGGETPPERDYEAEARSRGWLPEDEFKGDKGRWVDAQTFIERTDTVMPLLKADRDRLKRELDEMKRDFKRFNRFATEAETRIRAEIEAEMRAAVETGDVKKFEAAKKRETELDKGAKDQPRYTEADLVAAYDNFREEHAWYDRANLGSATETDINARIMFDRLLEKRAKAIRAGEEPPPDELLGEILSEVKAKFPALGAAAPRQKPASDVAGGGTPGRGRSSRTWEALPDEVRRRFEKWIGNGLGTKEEYLKTFDWDAWTKAGAR